MSPAGKGTAPAALPASTCAPALSKAFVDHHSVLKSYISQRVRSPQDAEDYVQEVYARVLASSTDMENFRSWRAILLRVATSVLLDRFRRDSVRRRDHHGPLDEADGVPDSGAACPETTAMRRQQLQRVRDALLELPPICRQAFLLARVEGWSHKEIAARLGIEPAAVGRHIERALVHLARSERDPGNAG